MADRTIEISGTPDARGTSNFSVVVTDGHGDQATIPVTITIASSGSGTRNIAPAAFTYQPLLQQTSSTLIWPASDGWWLSMVSIGSPDSSFRWISPQGDPGSEWSSQVQVGSVVAGPSGAMFMAGYNLVSGNIEVTRIGNQGSEITKTFPSNPRIPFEQQLAVGTDGHLYWYAHLGTGAFIEQLDPQTLATLRYIQVPEAHVGMTASPDALVVVDAGGSVWRYPYSLFTAANDGQDLHIPESPSLLQAGFFQISAADGGSVADMTDNLTDCESVFTSERNPDGTTWKTNLGSLVNGDVPSCQASDIDTLVSGAVVYTLRGSDGIYLMWVSAAGARTALVKVGSPQIIGLNVSTVSDDSGLVAVAYTDVHQCATPDPNGYDCSTISLATYRSGVLVKSSTLASSEQLMVPFVSLIGRPNLAFGHGQILVESWADDYQPCRQDNCIPFNVVQQFRTVLTDTDVTRHESFKWW